MAAAEKSRKEAILEETDAFIHSSISKMSPKEVKRFRRDSKRIMKDSERRMQKSGDTPETAQSPLRARRA
jgi:hypothetical protein